MTFGVSEVISGDFASVFREFDQTNPKVLAKAAAVARERLVRGWGWLGFWR
jgi:hypothetical protein